MVLYFPDSLVVIDRHRGVAERAEYEFACARNPALDTRAHPDRATAREPFVPASGARGGPLESDHAEGEFAAGVRRALDAFRDGDLFEVVLSQTFSKPNVVPPSDLYRRLRALNPSPYGFLMHLGQGEHLVGASPEMFVRVEGRRVETCPIAGTTARGVDAHDDARRILALLNDDKEQSELTMCTDVDRNDKARICEPGSVRVIGRRQVELYAKLIHTVDHVEGTLREDMDALDALLAHTWAVTVTGAPKPDAMQFIEDHERSARRFYSGAVGVVRLMDRSAPGLSCARSG